jgi:hypothetical protein
MTKETVAFRSLENAPKKPIAGILPPQFDSTTRNCNSIHVYRLIQHLKAKTCTHGVCLCVLYFSQEKKSVIFQTGLTDLSINIDSMCFL